jgi:hypothetical protein
MQGNVIRKRVKELFAKTFSGLAAEKSLNCAQVGTAIINAGPRSILRIIR